MGSSQYCGGYRGSEIWFWFLILIVFFCCCGGYGFGKY